MHSLTFVGIDVLVAAAFVVVAAAFVEVDAAFGEVVAAFVEIVAAFVEVVNYLVVTGHVFDYYLVGFASFAFDFVDVVVMD